MNAGALLQFDAIPVTTPPGAPRAIELVPAPDPWHVARRLAHLPHLLFLDSAEHHESRGRFSYIAANPIHWSASAGDGVSPSAFQNAARMISNRLPTIEGLPPFQGGLAGVFGYGLNRALEPRVPESRFDEFSSPHVGLGIYDSVISFDHQSGRAWLVTRGFDDDCSPATRSERKRGVEELLFAVFASQGGEAPIGSECSPTGNAITISRLSPQHPLPGFPHVTSNFSREGYEAAVRRAIEYIHAGDCFQVNLSQRLLAPLREHPLDLYGRLRQLNPAPFAGYLDLGDFQILSASPERFLQVDEQGDVESRPIKGTRPRGATVEEDAALVRELAASAKDRAENVMIVDLLRNDIGKVGEYGSVRVPRLCEIETFQFVHHLVSEVRGKLRPGLGPLDLLAAAFPGGSVTGAPKVRAMEIIAELEPTARGPYCGGLGWIGFNGAMDTNILIRTFTAGRGWVQFPVGGGIVAESDPAREYEETLHKATGLLRALK
jgi:para-aminobenzoate synthetase component 1